MDRDLLIDVGDVDGVVDDLVALRHAAAAVVPPPRPNASSALSFFFCSGHG
jgi:hypothetical protein